MKIQCDENVFFCKKRKRVENQETELDNFKNLIRMPQLKLSAFKCTNKLTKSVLSHNSEKKH